MTAKQLLEQRAKLCADARTILEGAETEDRAMNAEERKKWDDLHNEAKALKQRADDLHRQETAADVPDNDLRDHDRLNPRDGRSGGDDRDSLSRIDAFRAFCLGPRAPRDLVERCRRNGLNPYVPQAHFIYERPAGRDVPNSVHEARERRDECYQRSREQRAPQEVTNMDTFTPPSGASGPLGGFLVPNEMMAEIELAEINVSGMYEASRVVETDTGAPYPVPTNEDEEEGEIVGENQARGEKELTFGQIVLGAHMFSSKFIKVSIEALQDSGNQPATTDRSAQRRAYRPC